MSKKTTKRKNTNEKRAYGEWEAEVKTKDRGPNRPDIQRKVVTKGIKEIDIDMGEIVQLLRQGYEVRLGNTLWGDAIRIYPCLDTDYDTMFPAAATMGNFRDDALHDIRFTIRRRGEKTSAAECRRESDEKRKAIAKRDSAVPKRVVTCPKCGTEFTITGFKAD